MRIETFHQLGISAAQEAENLRVAEFTVNGQGNLVGVRPLVVRESVAAPGAFLDDAINPLARPLDDAATKERFRDAAVAGKLTVEHVLRRDSRREAARAVDLDVPGKLPHEDRAGMTVIAVADCVQKIGE